MVDMCWHTEEELLWPIVVFTVASRSDPSRLLELQLLQTACPGMAQEQAMTHHLTLLHKAQLGSAAHVMMSGDMQAFDSSTYRLYPGHGSTLGASLPGDAPFRYTSQPFLPWARSLPILADVLHGLRSLEEAGAVHCDLTAEDVALIDGRAYVTGLGKTCFQPLEEEVGAIGARHRCNFLGSRARKAPEMRTDGLVGSAGHVWSAGLLLAEMVFGPAAVARHLAGGTARRWPFGPPQGDGHPIERLPGWSRAPPGVQALLQEMLHDAAPRRGTTGEALQFVAAVAAKLGVGVREAAPALLLPSGWWAPQA